MSQAVFENDFQKAQFGASHITPSQWGALKKGGYAMLCGKPCKITEYSTAKTGKHGTAKATVVGVDIFTGKKYEDFGSTSSGCFIPNIDKEEYEIADISKDGKEITLLDENAGLIHGIKMPSLCPEDLELVSAIIKNYNGAAGAGKSALVTVLIAMGDKKIIDTRIR